MALTCTEQLIRTNSQGLPEARHLVLQGSQYEIGKKFGELARKRHHISKGPEGDSLRNSCQRLYLQQHYSEHYERMRGIADAYGIELENDDFDFSVLGRFPGGAGCSAVHYPPHVTASGHGTVSRNLDFVVDTAAWAAGQLESSPFARPYIVETYPEDGGYASLFLLSFEIIGESLEGINSEGLVVVHLADEESASAFPAGATQEPAVGLHEFLSVRLLLETCATVEEAKRALLLHKHFYRMVPVHLLIADRSGQSFVWEYGVPHNTEHIVEGGQQPQIVTNFLVHRYASLDDFPEGYAEPCNAFNRYRKLHQAVVSHPAPYTLDFIKQTNELVFFDGSMFLNTPDVPARTLFHCVYDTYERSLQVSFYLNDVEPPGGRSHVRSPYYTFQIQS